MFTLAEIVDLAVRIEKNGERTYRRAMGRARNPHIAKTLEYLASQEAAHAEWFSALDPGTAVVEEDDALARMGRKLLEEILGDQNFSLSDTDLAEIEDIDRLLVTSIAFENDTRLFYVMLRSVIDAPEVQAALDTIIDEERTHVTQLEAMQSQLTSG